MDTKLLFEYTKKMSVLYVEDDEELRTTTAELFSNYFDELMLASSAEDGYDIFTEKDYKFDLVISDIKMPGENGIQMAEKMMCYDPDITVILMSAHNEIEYLQGAIDIGISSFIHKPIKRELLDLAIFKVSQIINDRKFVLYHVDTMEELNMKLENTVRELEAKNAELEKSLRLLNTFAEKEVIAHPQTYEHSKEDSGVVDEEEKAFDEQIRQLVDEDLAELREIHAEIDRSVIGVLNISNYHLNDGIAKIISGFSRYASILSFYTFFNTLGSSMRDFSTVFQDYPAPEGQVENTFMILESFLYVLEKWQNELENENKEMINFFDASIISDMDTISSMWKNEVKEEEEDFGDMEFF